MIKFLLDYLPCLITPLLQVGFLLPSKSRPVLPKCILFYAGYGISSLLVVMTIRTSLGASHSYEWMWRFISIEYLFIAACGISFLSPILEDKYTSISIGSMILTVPVFSCLAVLTASRLATRPLVVLNLVNTSLVALLIVVALTSCRVKTKTKIAACGLLFLMAVRMTVSVYRLNDLWGHWEIVSRAVPVAEMLTSASWLIMSRAFGKNQTQTQKILKLQGPTVQAAVGMVYAYAGRPDNGRRK